MNHQQVQRVVLARAIFANADVVLLDEPLSALDAAVGSAVVPRCFGASGAFQGRAVVLVSADAGALRAADRLLALGGGGAPPVTHSHVLAGFKNPTKKPARRGALPAGDPPLAGGGGGARPVNQSHSPCSI